jgi:glycosyltransferase involved in cell wall biosynthesis
MRQMRKTKPHVLVVSHRFSGRHAGGTEVLTEDLARALVARGYEVSWLAAAEQSRDLVAAGLPAVRLVPVDARLGDHYPAQWQRREADTAERVAEALGSLPPVDLVHVTHFSRLGLGFLDIERLRDAPVVATLTDYTTVCAEYQLRYRPTGELCSASAPSERCVVCCEQRKVTLADMDAWRRRNLAWLRERCAAVWVQTPHQAGELADAGLPPERIVEDHGCYAVPDAWAALSRDPAPDTVLFLGRASPEKGLHILLEALPAIPDPVRLVAVTLPDDPNYERTLRQRAADEPRVAWLPPQPRDDLGTLLAGVRALAVPSQWYENHPIVVHYAMAVGVPVLCSDVPSMRHLARLGDIRAVAPPAEPSAWAGAVEKLMAEPIGTRPNRVTEFNGAYEGFVDRVTAVYEGVIAA